MSHDHDRLSGPDTDGQSGPPRRPGRPRRRRAGRHEDIAVVQYRAPDDPPDRRPWRVVSTHWIHPEAVDRLRGFSELVLPAAPEVMSRRQCLDLAADADALLMCMADSVDDAFLAGCPRLRLIGTVVRGHDNFDVDACARRGVWLTTLPDLLIEPTAELAVGLLLGLARHVRHGDGLIRTGGYAGWRPWFYGTGVHGSTVGLLGFGRLGRAVARRLGGFDPARILYHDTVAAPPEVERELGARPVDLPALLSGADLILVLVPLTGATRHLLDREALELVRPGTLLVNVARGSVVDEDAVVRALRTGRLGGYAADVFAMEDWRERRRPRRISPRLLEHPATLFTPHLGSAVDTVRRDMALAAARQVEQALVDGRRPDHEVTGCAGRPTPPG